jgi:hypothetical protein
MEQGTQLLAVASGYAALHGLVGLLPKSIERTERVSKFEVVSTDAGEVIGYLNSDLVLEPFVRVGNFVGTQLHGPVLAKTVWLADEIIVKKYELVDRFASGASELANELAGE